LKNELIEINFSPVEMSSESKDKMKHYSFCFGNAQDETWMKQAALSKALIEKMGRSECHFLEKSRSVWIKVLDKSLTKDEIEQVAVSMQEEYFGYLNPQGIHKAVLALNSLKQLDAIVSALIAIGSKKDT